MAWMYNTMALLGTTVPRQEKKKIQSEFWNRCSYWSVNQTKHCTAYQFNIFSALHSIQGCAVERKPYTVCEWLLWTKGTVRASLTNMRSFIVMIVLNIFANKCTKTNELIHTCYFKCGIQNVLSVSILK